MTLTQAQYRSSLTFLKWKQKWIYIYPSTAAVAHLFSYSGGISVCPASQQLFLSLCGRERKENGGDEKQSKALAVFWGRDEVVGQGKCPSSTPVPCGPTHDCLALVAELFPLQLVIQLLLPSTWCKISHFTFKCTKR